MNPPARWHLSSPAPRWPFSGGHHLHSCTFINIVFLLRLPKEFSFRPIKCWLSSIAFHSLLLASIKFNQVLCWAKSYDGSDKSAVTPWVTPPFYPPFPPKTGRQTGHVCPYIVLWSIAVASHGSLSRLELVAPNPLPWQPHAIYADASIYPLCTPPLPQLAPPAVSSPLHSPTR